MAIYTRFGETVEIIEAEEVPVWIVHNPGEIKWHYTEPKKLSKKSTVENLSIFHVRARTGEGRMILDGRQFPAGELRADEGWAEIVAACEAASKSEKAA